MSKKNLLLSDNNDSYENKFSTKTTEKVVKYHPGEKGFAIFLFLFGLFFTYQSFLMYIAKPGASSHAAVPLFVSILIVIFSTLIFIFDFKKDSTNDGIPFSKKIEKTLYYMLPKDVLVIIVLILLYCIALMFNFGFYLITPLFLWAAMSYLMNKNYVKNILWTALNLLFIYIVFSFVFNVVLP